jgi:hypothetical protein
MFLPTLPTYRAFGTGGGHVISLDLQLNIEAALMHSWCYTSLIASQQHIIATGRVCLLDVIDVW